jgi:hypothetical protein
MKLLFPRSIFLLSLFIATQSFSQSNIGGLNCSILKSNQSSDQNLVQIIFKNQKYIYQQESDTIKIQDPLKLKLLIKDLKEGLTIIDDDQKTVNFNSGFYIIVKDNLYMDHKVLTFWNKDYNISASINKSSLTQLIDWLEAIKF